MVDPIKRQEKEASFFTIRSEQARNWYIREKAHTNEPLQYESALSPYTHFTRICKVTTEAYLEHSGA